MLPAAPGSAGIEIEIDPQRGAETCAWIETTADPRIASSAATVGRQAGRIDHRVFAGAGDASLIFAIEVELPSLLIITLHRKSRKPQARDAIVQDGHDRVVLDPRIIIVIGERPDSDRFATRQASSVRYSEVARSAHRHRGPAPSRTAGCCLAGDLDANAIEILTAGEIAGDDDEQSAGRLVVAANQR